MSELLPCPHCGGAAAVYAPPDDSETRWAASVTCHHCGVSLQMAALSSDRGQIIAAWNRRVNTTTQPTESQFQQGDGK